MAKICFIRHGETLWNLEGRTQGTSDIELSDNGKRQGRCIGKHLKEKGFNIVKIYCSNLTRAIDTAKEINSYFDLPIEIREEFRELSFGSWEGMKISDIDSQYGEELKKWRVEPHNMVFSTGDSLNGIKDRSLGIIDIIVKNLDKDDMILIVSHAAAIKTMIISLLGLSLDNYYKFSLSNASISIIDSRPYGYVLGLYNDVNHLDMI